MELAWNPLGLELPQGEKPLVFFSDGEGRSELVWNPLGLKEEAAPISKPPGLEDVEGVEEV